MKFNESHIEAMYKYFIFYEYNYIYRNKKYDPKDPNSGGKYFNAINPHTKKPFKLTKKQIENHLAGKDTIGVRAKNYTKFMCLDIDTKGDQAKQDARNLISLLQVEFNISIEHIHLVNSANKGYHIFLIFDDIVSVSNMEKFYIDILNKSQYSTSEIELRPTNMAVKLPLGVNPSTNKVSYFCNPRTLRIIRSYDPLLNIKQMNHKFIEQYQTRHIKHISKHKQNEAEQIANETEIAREKIEFHALAVDHFLKHGVLYEKDSRHKVSLMVASYLRTQGKSKDATKRIINKVLKNTIEMKPGYISTPIEHIEAKTSQIVDSVWKNAYTFSGGNSTVTFGIDEIVDCLNIEHESSTKQWHLKKLFFLFLVHSKRHANQIDGSFFFAYSTMAKMGIDKNRNRTLENIQLLEDLGLIEIVSRNQINNDPEEFELNKIKLPNVYRIKKEYNSSATKLEIVPNESIKFEKILYELHKDNVINLRNYIKKTKFFDIQKQYRDA